MIVAAAILAAVVALGIGGHAYYEKAMYYKDHFYTGTVINGVNCSDMTLDQARMTVQDKLNDYTFTFTDHEGVSTTVTAPELEVTYLDNGEIEQLLDAQNILMWAFENDEEENYSVTSGYTYSEEKLRGWTGMLPCVTDAVAPTDAYDTMNEEGLWEIVPETYGDEPDSEALYGIIKEAVDLAKPAADLENVDIFLKPAVLADDAELTASVEEKNNAIIEARELAAKMEKIAEMTEEITDVELRFNSYEDKVCIDKELMTEWLVEDEEGYPLLDEDQVRDWVREWAVSRGFDKNRNLFVTHGGKLMDVSNGILGGWSMDLEATIDQAVEDVKNHKKGVFYAVLKDDSGKLQSETSYVEINILKQTMWYYEKGEEIVETPIVTGNTATGHDTPTNGIWYIYQKMTDYTMRGVDYVTHVDYWMPFNDQIGIHDMQSRPAFGGNIYQGSGSHGCVNTPLEAVIVIFEHAQVGTPVVVHS